MADDHEKVKMRIDALYNMLAEHDGYGEMRIDFKILKRGQKEVIIHCGKQYRYVVDAKTSSLKNVVGVNPKRIFSKNNGSLGSVGERSADTGNNRHEKEKRSMLDRGNDLTDREYCNC